MLGEYLGAGSGITKGLYHLNGNSTDSSGNGKNGTDTAITYSQANGKFGQGAGFNGSTSGIQTPFTTMTAGTLSVWYKGSDVTNDALFVVNQNTTGSANYMQFIVGLFSAGNIAIYSTLAPGSGTVVSTATGVVSTDTWTNIIFTQTGTQVTVYVNGHSRATEASTFWFGSVPNANQYCIGSLKRGTEIYSPTAGSIDEVIIENVAWSAEKIKKYYTFAKGRFGL